MRAAARRVGLLAYRCTRSGDRRAQATMARGSQAGVLGAAAGAAFAGLSAPPSPSHRWSAAGCAGLGIFTGFGLPVRSGQVALTQSASVANFGRMVFILHPLPRPPGESIRWGT